MIDISSVVLLVSGPKLHGSRARRIAFASLGTVCLACCAQAPQSSGHPATPQRPPVAAASVRAAPIGPPSPASLVVDCRASDERGFIDAAQRAVRPALRECFRGSQGPFAGDWAQVSSRLSLSHGRLAAWKVEVAGSSPDQLRPCIEDRLANLSVTNCRGSVELRWTSWLGGRQLPPCGQCSPAPESGGVTEPCFSLQLRRQLPRIGRDAVRCLPQGAAAATLNGIALLFDNRRDDRITAVIGAKDRAQGDCLLALADKVHPDCEGTDATAIEFPTAQ